MVKRYSKLKLINALESRGLYFRLRDFLQNSAGGIYWDKFMAAQELSSDYPAFSEMLPAVQAALEVSGDLAMEILAEAEISEEG